MNAFCPNLSNPQIKQEFAELVQAVGEDAAYYLWNKNNGYSLESAPNGAPSRLFKDLLDYYSGDREKAIQTKGKTYLQQFKDQFGDWLTLANNKSKSNIIQHGTGSVNVNYILNDDGSVNFDKLVEISDNYFNNADEALFKKGRKTLRTRKEHHEGETNTLEHLQNVVKSAQKANIKEELKTSLILAAALHDIAKPFHGGQLHGYQSVDVVNKIFDDSISPLIKFAIRHHMMTTVEGVEFTQDDANKIIQDAIDNNINLQDAVELLLALNTADIVRGRDLSKIDQYSNKTIKETISQEIPYKRTLLENAIRNTSGHITNVSKAVDENGEPTIQSLKLPKHESTDLHQTKNGEKFVKLQSRASKSLFETEQDQPHSNDVIQRWIEQGIVRDELLPLAKVLQKHNILIRFTDKSDGFMTAASEKKGGHVHVIYVNTNALSQESIDYTVESLLHEMMHAITTEQLDNNPNGDFAKSARKLLNIYRAYYSDRIGIDRSLYGLTDQYEFVAEYLTHAAFRDKLLYAAKNIDDHRTDIRNTLRKFINSVLDVFCDKRLYGKNEKQLREFREALFNHALNYKQIHNSGAISIQELNQVIDQLDEAVVDKHNMMQTSKDLGVTIGIFHETKKSLWSKLDEKYHRTGTGTYLGENKKATVKVATKSQAEAMLQKIENEIASVLDIRIKAVRHSKMDVAERKRVVDGLKAQHDAFTGSTMNAIQSLTYFLETTAPDLISEAEKIKAAVDNIYTTGRTTFNESDYNESMHDYFGVYQEVYNRLSSLFNDPAFRDWISDYKSSSINHFQTMDDFIHTINLAKQIVQQSTELLNYLRDFNLRNRLSDLGEDTGNSTEMQEFLDKWNEDVPFNDTFSGNKVFGAADKNSDVMVRAAAHLIKNATDIATSESMKRITKLSSIAQRLQRGHKITDIYEKDDENLPTGNLVRKYNYGKFRKDRAKFLKELNAKYSTEEEPLAPDNVKQPRNKEYRAAWAKEYNAWMDAHANRRYTKEYYDMFSELSWEAYNIRNEIQSAIRAVKSKYWNEDKQYFDYETVPDGVDANKWIKQRDEDIQRLNELYAQRRELSSIYDSHGNKKEGKDLEIAEELQKLNEKLYTKGNASKNTKLWKQLRDKMIEECGGLENYKKGRGAYDNTGIFVPNTAFDFDKFDAWEKRNTRVQYKVDDDNQILMFKKIEAEQEVFLKQMGVTKVPNENSKALNDAINQLLKPYRNVNSGEIDMSILPVQVRNRVIDLQRQQADIRGYHFETKDKDGKTIVLSDEDKFATQIRKGLGEIFGKYAQQVTTDAYNDGLRAAQMAAEMSYEEEGFSQAMSIEAALNQDGSISPEVMAYYQETGTIEERIDYMTGEIIYIPHPYRFYTKIIPQPEYQDQFMEIMPGDNFIYTQDENPFLNKEYDESEEESIVPKKSGTWNGEKFSYDNSKAYNKIQDNEDLKRLYDETLSILTEIKEIHNNIPFLSKYHLPAITGDMIDAFKGKDKWSKAYLMFKRFLPWTINEQDTDYQQTVALKPDGSELNFIPQPFTDTLENPQMQSTDLLGSMYLYYLKSVEYREKNKIKDTVEAMLDATADRKFGSGNNIKTNKESNTYQTLKNHINMMLYEQSNRGKYKSFLKFMNSYRNFASTVNLGGSPKVSLVGLLTTMQAHIINGIVGKRYSLAETARAGIAVMWDLIQSPFRGGTMGYKSRSFQQNLNEEFNISDQGANKFRHSNRNKFVNALCYGFWYGPMTMADWLAKSQILDSVLMDYRFVGGRFISKQDLVNKYYDRGTFTGGEIYRQKLKEWKKAESLYNILYKAHNTKRKSEEMFTIPEEYKEAYQKVKHVVMNRAQKYAASADGMLTPNQKAWFMTTWYGSLIMMHRQYLPQMIQERLSQRVWDMDTQEYTYGVYRMLWDMFWAPIKDGWNAYRILRSVPNPENKASIGKALNAARKAYGSRSKQALIDSMTDPINRWALKQVIAEFAIHKAIVLPMTSYIVTLADDPDNDDNNLLQLIAYIAVAYQWESFTAYRPTDMFNNIMTVTAAQGVTGRLSYVWGQMFSFSFSNNSLLNWVFGGPSGETETKDEKENIVKSGAYKGWDRTLMNMFKLTPAHNIYEQWYGSEAKRRYFENVIMKQ